MWFHVPSWEWRPPPRSQCRRGAEGRPLTQAESPLLLWKSQLCTLISSWCRGQANLSSQEDQGSVFLQFDFLKIENTFPMLWLMSSFSCSKTASGKVRVLSHCLMFSAKNNPQFHSEGADGWSLTTVRCFAPAEVKASNPFWREQWRGCLRTASAKHVERHHEHNRQEFRLPPSEAVLFPNKGC